MDLPQLMGSPYHGKPIKTSCDKNWNDQNGKPSPMVPVPPQFLGNMAMDHKILEV